LHFLLLAHLHVHLTQMFEIRSFVGETAEKQFFLFAPVLAMSPICRHAVESIVSIVVLLLVSGIGFAGSGSRTITGIVLPRGVWRLLVGRIAIGRIVLVFLFPDGRAEAILKGLFKGRRA
jgi:hypothetical protein